MSNAQWRTVFGVVAAVCTYALATELHPEVILQPWVSFILGAVLVGLAVIKAPEDPT